MTPCFLLSMLTLVILDVSAIALSNFLTTPELSFFFSFKLLVLLSMLSLMPMLFVLLMLIELLVSLIVLFGSIALLNSPPLLVNIFWSLSFVFFPYLLSLSVSTDVFIAFSFYQKLYNSCSYEY